MSSAASATHDALGDRARAERRLSFIYISTCGLMAGMFHRASMARYDEFSRRPLEQGQRPSASSTWTYNEPSLPEGRGRDLNIPSHLELIVAFVLRTIISRGIYVPA